MRRKQNFSQLIDGGRTLTIAAGRLAPEYRRRGLYGHFLKLVLNRHIQSPDLRYIAFTVINNNMAVNGESLLKTYTKVLEKTLAVVELTSSDFSLYEKKKQDLSGMRILSRDDVTSMMSSVDLLHLFPARRIILDWKPYRLIPENVPIITNTCTHIVFVATDAESSCFLDKPPSSLPRILSAGSYYRCKIGTCYTVDLFGDGSDEELRAHITWHILRSAETGNGHVAFIVAYTRSLDEIMADLGKSFPLRKSNLPFKQLISLEQELKQGFL